MGPLAGIAHQAGQFPQLTLQQQHGSATAHDAAGTSAGGAPLDAGLEADMQLLRQLREATRGVLYNGMASESDCTVHPIVLQDPGATVSAGAQSQSTGTPGAGEEVGNEAAAAPFEIATAALYRCLALDEGFRQFFEPPQGFSSLEDLASGCRGARYFSRGDDSDAAVLGAALSRLAGYTRQPLAQVVLGNEECMINPVPVVWVGLSPHDSRRLLGLITAVVWT